MKKPGDNVFITYKGDKARTTVPNDKPFKSANALTKHVIEESNLFSDLIEETVTEETPEYEVLDAENKTARLSLGEWDTIRGLQRCLSSRLEEPEIKSYIQTLPFEIANRLKRDINGNEYTKHLKKSVTLLIDIAELAKDMKATDRIGGRELLYVRGWLEDLARKKHRFKYKTANGGSIEITQPFISISTDVVVKDANGNVKKNVVEIMLEDVFVYGLYQNKGYSLEPANIFHLLKDAGPKPELFRKLYDFLKMQRGIKVKEAAKANAKTRREMEATGAPEEEIEKAIKIAEEKALTVDMRLNYILSMIDKSKFFYTTGRRAGTLRKDRIEAQKEIAIKTLENVGIIQSGRFYESTATDGSIKWNFLINPNWINNNKDE